MVTEGCRMAHRAVNPLTQVDEDSAETDELLSHPQETGNLVLPTVEVLTEAKTRPRRKKSRFTVTTCPDPTAGALRHGARQSQENAIPQAPSGNNNDTKRQEGKRPGSLDIPSPRRKTFTVTNYGNVISPAVSPSSPTSAPEICFEPPSPKRPCVALDIGHGPQKPRTRKVSVLEHDDGILPEIRVEEVPDDDVPDAVWSRQSSHEAKMQHNLLPIPEVNTNGHIPDTYGYPQGSSVTYDFRFPEKYNGSVTRGYKAAADIAKLGRLYATRKVDRLVNKDGRLNITYKNIKTKNYRFLADIFTTMLDTQWRYTLLIFILGFVLSWLLFGVVWYVVAIANHEGHPCVDGVTDFHTALLFSIETQHTIGYGTRAANVTCPVTTFILMFQSVFGVIVQCVMAGIVFAKLARPKHRAHTIIFSKKAVICQEDGQYCLQFRVGDMRTSKLIGGVIHAIFIKKHVTKEGYTIPFEHYQLDIQTVTCSSIEDHDRHIFLAWPVRIVHHINEKSPLYGMSSDDLLKEDFEIIVILEGVVESTGGTTQVRTSYLPAEILWGHRLESLLTGRRQTGAYEIDYTHFHQAQPCDMPDESARDHAQRRPDMQEAGAQVQGPPHQGSQSSLQERQAALSQRLSQYLTRL